MKTQNDHHASYETDEEIPLGFVLQNQRFSEITLVRTKRCMLYRTNGLIEKMERFTRMEWKIFLTLCQSYPHVSPYEILLRDTQLLSTLRNNLYRMKKKL